ncbi:beta-ketoacyl synthase N-terminal-like domain-containing protein [Streptomyces silvensis]|uniref:beta-ketoacyl synthase N-terminal-like domain-containing protein n=1 Tax=Streptomyces silvensis TaxID=1765722 RepID=UPI001F522DFA|nr:beta-ketoacyl synthase N-terminal-like domain-containing protein [Streptomyces silvensis]
MGIGCRLPGGVQGPAALWRLLAGGQEIPHHRLTDRPSPGHLDPRDRLIGDIDAFDAQFFGIAPREAATMDPQHRLLLEVACEALQDGGLHLTPAASAPSGPSASSGPPVASGPSGPSASSGPSMPPVSPVSPVMPVTPGEHTTGVYIATSSNDYAALGHPAARPDLLTLVGGARASAAARLSHHLRRCGPSVVLDTDRSSGLTALHLALHGLRSGECDLALAGAANLVLAEETGAAFGAAGMLAADGRCKFGSAAADGFARSEAVVVVALKRLADARAADDRIYAVVAGSALNHDASRSGDFLAPSHHAQQAVVHRACADAGITADELTYVEAHGTGTPVGDRVELTGLAALPRRGTPLLVGSVKTNVGHTEAAAGLLGLVKVALMIEHRQLVPTLHSHPPAPHAQSEGLALADGHAPWPVGEGVVGYAGVSSFGLMGANGHAVLAPPVGPYAAADPGGTAPDGTALNGVNLDETAPDRVDHEGTGRGGTSRGAYGAQDMAAPGDPEPWPVALSARTPEALLKLCADYRRLLTAAEVPPALRDIAWTAGARRDHHPCRLLLLAHTHEDLLEALDRALAGDPAGSPDAVGESDATGTAARLVRRYEAGEDIAWSDMLRPGRTVRLPAHPWTHGRYWASAATDLAAVTPATAAATATSTAAATADRCDAVRSHADPKDAVQAVQTVYAVQAVQEVRSHVAGAVERVLGYVPDASLPLSDAGIGSLTGLELRHALMDSLGLDLAPTLIYEHPTIDALCHHIRDLRRGAPGPEQGGDDLDAVLGSLTERFGLHEAARLLDTELTTLLAAQADEENV